MTIREVFTYLLWLYLISEQRNHSLLQRWATDPLSTISWLHWDVFRWSERIKSAEKLKWTQRMPAAFSFLFWQKIFTVVTQRVWAASLRGRLHQLLVRILVIFCWCLELVWSRRRCSETAGFRWVSITGGRTSEQSRGRKRRRRKEGRVYISNLLGKTHKANEEERRGHEYY